MSENTDKVTAYRNLSTAPVATTRETAPTSSFNNPILATFRMTSDEAWSDYTSTMFAVCDFMYSRYPNAIDPEWGYSPSPMMSPGEEPADADSWPLAEFIETEPTEAECVLAGRVLNRYGDMLRRLHLDY